MGYYRSSGYYHDFAISFIKMLTAPTKLNMHNFLSIFWPDLGLCINKFLALVIFFFQQQQNMTEVKILLILCLFSLQLSELSLSPITYYESGIVCIIFVILAVCVNVITNFWHFIWYCQWPLVSLLLFIVIILLLFALVKFLWSDPMKCWLFLQRKARVTKIISRSKMLKYQDSQIITTLLLIKENKNNS